MQEVVDPLSAAAALTMEVGLSLHPQRSLITTMLSEQATIELA